MKIHGLSPAEPEYFCLEAIDDKRFVKHPVVAWRVQQDEAADELHVVPVIGNPHAGKRAMRALLRPDGCVYIVGEETIYGDVEVWLDCTIHEIKGES